ncbi:uncharacterized protein LOC106648066 [Trichogramma pretiosum]|uniref:uncharacterized protein LOC106648066 n=1 Tax=Trichogramma pretiosum TaxID=7493 RepID=UPI0006C9D5C5|nr:uncharacterized protein LOC106648066 [Trichogramma pretiosum]
MACKDGLFLLEIVLLTALLLVSYSEGQLTGKEHRTHAAAERKDDLWCYQCDSIGEGDSCFFLNITGNDTSLAQKCKDDRRICMVKRFSYTTSTENSTSQPKMWGMERNCTNKCEEGCIVIGERTKLYACTTCCEKNYCNTGNGQSADYVINDVEFFLAVLLQFILAKALSPCHSTS